MHDVFFPNKLNDFIHVFYFLIYKTNFIYLVHFMVTQN